MNEIRYLGKKVLNDQKELIGFSNLVITNSGAKPRGGGYEILKGIETSFPKAILVGNEWQVVEDAARKDANEAKERQKAQRKQELVNAISSIDILTLPELKTLIKKVLEHLLNV